MYNSNVKTLKLESSLGAIILTVREVKRKIAVKALAAVVLAIIIFISSHQLTSLIMEFRGVKFEEIAMITTTPATYSENIFSKKLMELESAKATTLAPMEAKNLPPRVVEKAALTPQIIGKLNLSAQEVNKLSENGFIVKSLGKITTFNHACNLIRERQIPLLITVDLVLHYYHALYELLAAELEAKYLTELLKELCKSLAAKADFLYTYTPLEYERAKEALEKISCYLQVAAKILDENHEVPKYAARKVDEEIRLINSAEGIHISPVLEREIDYTIFKPKKHYTLNSKLEKYYKAITWLSIEFPIENGDELLQAIMLIKVLEDTTTTINGKTLRAKEIWEKIYLTNSFLNGYLGKITVHDLERAISNIFGSKFSILNLEDEVSLILVRNQLQRILEEKQATSKIWDLMDDPSFSFMGFKLHLPKTLLERVIKAGKKPSGLDLALILSLNRAREHLARETIENPEYEVEVSELKDIIENFKINDWTKNWDLYHTHLLKVMIDTKNPKQLAAVNADAWQDRILNTILALWSEHEHGITRQLITENKTGEVSISINQTAYLEPAAELYTKILFLCKATLSGLEELGVVDQQIESTLREMADMAGKLVVISIKELNGEKLSSEEKEFLLTIDLKFREIMSEFKVGEVEATMITQVIDVLGQKLQIGCGFIEFIILPIQENGEIQFCAGPILTYYELVEKHEIGDEEWKMLLELGIEKPAWIKNLHGSS